MLQNVKNVRAHYSETGQWFNEPFYTNPGTEGLNYGLRTVSYVANSSNQFLNQYVCVDSLDRAIPQDPISCSSKRRLKIGEDLPYVKFSKNLSTGKRTVMQNSFPIAFGNRARFINTRTGGGGLNSSRVFRNYMTGDGYDILDNFNGWSFIYGTRDPVTTSSQFIWCGEFGNLGGGWMLSQNPPSTPGSGVFKIEGGNYDACRPTNLTYTEWTPLNMVFSSGKQLDVVRTMHFSHSTRAASTTMEMFYQSKIYGGVRWEAWKTVIPSNNASAECNGSPTMQLDGKTWYRSMCKDWTFIEPLTLPLHASHVPLTSVFTTSSNLMINSDFVNGENGWQFDNGPSGLLKHSSVKDPLNGNPYLVLEKISGDFGNIYQVSPTLGARGPSLINGGLLIRSTSANFGGVLGIEVISDTGVEAMRKIRFTFKNTEWTAVRFHFQKNFAQMTNVRLRFVFYPKGLGKFELDEAFLNVMDLPAQLSN